MNPELQNYIKQARIMGKSDQTITQELSSGGWTQADINQALGSPILGTSAVGSAVVATGGISGKIVGIIAVILIILGVGGYFVYSKKTSTQTPADDSQTTDQTNSNQVATTEPSTKTTTTNTEAAKAPFGCKDILSDTEFEATTGKKIADYKLSEEFGTATSINKLSCKYEPINKTKEIFLPIIFSIQWSPNYSATWLANALMPKAPDLESVKALGGSEAEYQEILKNVNALQKVSTVGLGAYYLGMGTYIFAATGDKYHVIIQGTGFAGGGLNTASETSLNLYNNFARTLDANLSKY
jgi:hypothetical protein